MRLRLSLPAMMCVFLGARSASAQPTTSWTQSNVASTAQAAGFVYSQTITPFGGTPLAPIQLTGVTCSGTVPSVSCSAPLPAAGVAALITGAKSTLTATDPSTGAVSPSSAPFTPGPSAPTALKVG